ncbi:MAG TPA: DotI/IcmL/TraM family protein [Acetobacteraceae bacterium]|nr:DotI/IcmL/TraM family protein [Acetobacteraceae bacterium]
MQNQHAAVMRRLSDPDFQASLVNRCIALALGVSALLVAFVAHDAYVWTHPPAPRYFFIDGKHPPRPVTALGSPIVDDTELLDWTVKAVLAAYNVNYHDYPEQLTAAGRRFTPHGWSTFATSYIKGGNFAEMKHAMLLCYAQAQRAAIIRQTSIVDGALAYQIQFPLVQTCQNTNQQSTQNMVMTALVVRTNSNDHPDGLAVDQLVATAH